MPLSEISLSTRFGQGGNTKGRGWQLRPSVCCLRPPISLREAHDRLLGGVGGLGVRAGPSVEGIVAAHPVSGA